MGLAVDGPGAGSVEVRGAFGQGIYGLRHSSREQPEVQRPRGVRGCELRGAVRTSEGDPDATNEVLRVSSRVAAVVAYYPPVDLRPWSGPIEGFPATLRESALLFARGVTVPGAADRFVALKFEEGLGASVWPILHVSSDDPPTLLVHGDADALVDLNNSELMRAAVASAGVVTDLVVIEGAGHGFRSEADSTRASDALVGWFEEHLAGR